jgi:hypothetical protein
MSSASAAKFTHWDFEPVLPSSELRTSGPSTAQSAALSFPDPNLEPAFA